MDTAQLMIERQKNQNELQRALTAYSDNYNKTFPETDSVRPDRAPGDDARDQAQQRDYIAGERRIREDFYTARAAASAARSAESQFLPVATRTARMLGGLSTVTPEAVAAGAQASAAVYAAASARRDWNIAYAEAVKDVNGPDTEEYRDKLRTARTSGPVARAAYDNAITAAVEAYPSVIAARNALDAAVANTLPPNKRADYIKMASETSTPQVRNDLRANNIIVATNLQAAGRQLAGVVTAQSQITTGPRGTTPVAPPKPAKKAPKKPLKKPKGRR